MPLGKSFVFSRHPDYKANDPAFCTPIDFLIFPKGTDHQLRFDCVRSVPVHGRFGPFGSVVALAVEITNTYQENHRSSRSNSKTFDDGPRDIGTRESNLLLRNLRPGIFISKLNFRMTL
ncbi:hypothetical protein TNCT_585151 [Trichonephila clavata]|uniref:Uncharacterized protein n=1 Tax=Trichonephila clavata TaxID=2740835 RepID=A0A8X6I9F3_TRICU|nr:hypothetical protein TNCT_585151 [Trichonephila clavata]